MSLFEPPNPNPDDMWAAIIADVGEIEVDEVDYSTKSTVVLLGLRTQVQAKLESIDNLLHPQTEEGRELQSRLDAINFHLRQRRQGGNQAPEEEA